VSADARPPTRPRDALDASFELKAGALRAAFRPDLGGAVAGLWHDRTPVLWSTDPVSMSSPRPSGSFPLVPYSNRLGYRRFRWRGHDYTTRANVAGSPHSLHGVGWQRGWRIVASSAVDLVIELEHAADADWPFAFAARQSFALAPDALTARLQLINRDPREQPLGLGWHPYFVRRPRSRLHVEADARWETDSTKLPTRKVVQHGIDSDVAHLDYDHAFDGFRGAARIRDERFSLRLESSLERLVVYTPTDRDWFCVEPVSHVPNAVHMADPAAHGLVAVAPGAGLEASLRLEVAVV
jgi:aldose 1-epimerase